jgi:hypothetical protein
MSIVYKELVNSTIQKLSSNLKRPKRPNILVNVNEHKISAPFDTGANVCCMTAAKFRQVFPVGKRPKKLYVISTVTTESGNQKECEGDYPIPFEINKKNFVYNVHILK